MEANMKVGGNNDVVQQDDLGDGTQCSKHPYRANLGGGICAFCLQEKLGKLVSSSFPLPIRPSPSSANSSSASSPPSDVSSATAASSSGAPNLDANGYPNRDHHHRHHHSRRAKIPGFLYSKKKKNNKHSSAAPSSADIAFKRSNTAPRRAGHLGGFLDGDRHGILEYSPRKKGFWSFLYLSVNNHPSSSASRHHNGATNNGITSSSSSSAVIPGKRAERMTPLADGSKRCADVIPEDEVNVSNGGDVANSSNSFERKVSRSRSVGCGSRSFSGDFFERISTGFGDCTLRRVESQREPNNGHSKHRISSADPDYCMKERVRCGGIFSGFMMASSSSSSSSSSYWMTASSSEVGVSSHQQQHHHHGANGVRSATPAGVILHGRNRSWGWAFASPMRAFSKPSSKDGKSGKSSNATPNLNAIPSLLTVGG